MKSVLLGLDLGGTNIKCVLLDSKTLTPAKKTQIPTGAKRGTEAVIGTMAKIIKEFVAWSCSNKMKLASIGIGSAGLVNNGIVRNSPNLPGWQGAVPLERLLKSRLAGHSLPLFIDNDANCFVLAETRCGAAKGFRNVIGLTLGTGVGGGIIIAGSLYRGSTGGAGELGHVSIKYDGPLCLCGNHGCLEALVGAAAIVKRYNDLRLRAHARLDRSVTVADISDRAKGGELLARQCLHETGRMLGVGLANYVNIFNPEALVIGGGVAQARKHIMAPAIEEMKRRAMPYNARSVKIRLARLGPWAGAIGAALLNKGLLP
jgi:glucokinase